MWLSAKKQVAEQSYRAGLALFQERRYEQALIELRRAEDAFRKLDARGHPLNHVLANGVTGFANALALSGHCHQMLGHYEEAIVCFETSLINAKFERPKQFRAFVACWRENLAACYAVGLKKLDDRMIQGILNSDSDIEIDTTYLFPFSLDARAIPIARLYELAPDRYPQFSEFYAHVKAGDREFRRKNMQRDDTNVRRTAVYIWIILGTLWIAYSVFVSRELFLK